MTKAKMYSKRYCVECGGEQKTFIVRHKRHDMYHCAKCRQEVSRVGDAPGAIRSTDLLGGSLPRTEDESSEREAATTLARQNPDLLSEERTLWPARDVDDAMNHGRRAVLLTAALRGLTARQTQVLQAVYRHKVYRRVAAMLGMSPQGVHETMKQIQKKLGKVLDIGPNGG